MPKPKKEIKILTRQEVFDSTNACITCVYEDECTRLDKTLPFPLNLCEHCEKFEKIAKIID